MVGHLRDEKDPRTYEHVEPDIVGNVRKVLVSDQGGQSNILAELKRCGFALEKGDARIARVLDHKIALTSTLGKGTEFAVEVPLSSAAPVREQPRHKVARLERALECEQRDVVTVVDGLHNVLHCQLDGELGIAWDQVQLPRAKFQSPFHWHWLL